MYVVMSRYVGTYLVVDFVLDGLAILLVFAFVLVGTSLDLLFVIIVGWLLVTLGALDGFVIVITDYLFAFLRCLC